MIGILYICTGRYIAFWHEFYLSSNEKFLPDKKKKYFVFTDKPWKFWFKYKNVRVIYISKKKWPYNTLFRYKYFSNSKSLFNKCDFLYFLNANVLFLKTIGSEIIPKNENNLVAVIHPGFYDKKSTEFTYERNKNSSAFIPMGKGQFYFMGGINGGTRDAFLKMSIIISKNIEQDLEKDIIAVWHDESHLNKYLLEYKSLHILNYTYGSPEDWNLPLEPKILILDKGKLGGHNYFREI